MRKILNVWVLFLAGIALKAESAISISPATGQGGEFDATVTISDPNGIENISEVRLLIKHDMNAAAACYLVHYPGTRTVLLRNDVDAAWGKPVALGTSDSDANSQCTIYGGPAATTTTADTYSLRVHLHFAKQFAGVRRMWVQTIDNRDPGSARWNLGGEWLVSGDTKLPPRTERFRPTEDTARVDTTAVPDPESEPKVYRNGLLLSPSDDYTIAGTTVFFYRSLMAGDVVQVEYSPFCSLR